MSILFAIYYSIKGIDFVAISDSYWLNMDTPCLTYGLRGVIYFYVYVDGSERDIHSGSHGGAVQEPLADLQALMSSLVDDKGEIMVPEVYDFVRRPEETELRQVDEFSCLTPSHLSKFLEFNPKFVCILNPRYYQSDENT